MILMGRYIPMDDQKYIHVPDMREKGRYIHIPYPYDGGYGPYFGHNIPYDYDPTGEYSFDKFQTVSNPNDPFYTNQYVIPKPEIYLQYGFPQFSSNQVGDNTDRSASSSDRTSQYNVNTELCCDCPKHSDSEPTELGVENTESVTYIPINHDDLQVESKYPNTAISEIPNDIHKRIRKSIFDYSQTQNSLPKPTPRPRKHYDDEGKWKIIRQDENKKETNYEYLYETENGILAEEQAVVGRNKNYNSGTSGQGFYQYVGDDDRIYRVEYTVGEQGFVPKYLVINDNKNKTIRVEETPEGGRILTEVTLNTVLHPSYSNVNMDAIYSLEEPLKGPIYKFHREWEKATTFRGPKRVIRLFLLGVTIPLLFIAIPLYLKHRVYDYQVYPVGMSDMRLIDNKVSTTWCQRQIVKANTTFNAFLMSDSPHVTKARVPVSMTRHLQLSDDMKEYWGFYLLKGSSVTVSTCARWPGASLILIRGHRHLHECAYIGDNSSEELEELMEIAMEKGVIFNSEEISESDDNPANRVELLTKHRPEVVFHDGRLRDNAHSFTFAPDNEDNSANVNAKQMTELLNQLALKTSRKKSTLNTHTKWTGEKKDSETFITKLGLDARKGHIHNRRNPSVNENENVKIEPHIVNATSAEELENILQKLKLMGAKGKRVMELLKKQLSLNEEESEPKTKKVNSSTTKPTTKLPTMRSVIESASIEKNLLRQKREFVLKTAIKSKELNEEEEETANLAIEEGYQPDGIADHHHVLNETTLNDRSNSEFWSSFSSSEEALLNCAGLILSLPLTPHRLCASNRSDKEFDEANAANTVTYSVPQNGYYFFVFNSENEVQENYVRVDFDLQKTMYDVSDAEYRCYNSTIECSLPLNFFSKQKVVFELPLKNNESLWNEEFIVTSECEPRTIVYLICVLSVPLLILLFAFH
ncbi:Larval cuticle protein LCP-30 [Pseudolycoriella hygida]|uniref:Larval cuticle protein LCP-30 n=1 Tax=Pseudolycoriella hygida TaxID=35572 RepID=A0A9Q0N7Y6_9DIPT|nr:Larval cuticle protein LCP-30 [Pseudolycoriella hygida]